MDILSYIQSMPKAEINISLEGAVDKSVWLLIAEQNEIQSESRKSFMATLDLLERRDPSRFRDISAGVCSWLKYPDDLARLAYNAGLTLHKQNIKYAEITVNPSLFMLGNMTFDTFMAALNDGRDRVERGWGIIIRWNLAITREEPRRADEVIRWASSATGKKHGIVGCGLVGQEDAQPVSQFERTFQSAKKKDLPAFIRVNDATEESDNIENALNLLDPVRIVGGVGLSKNAANINKMIDGNIPLIMTPARSKKPKLSGDDYPIRDLLEKGISLVVTSDMPTYFDMNTIDVYKGLYELANLSISEFNQIALNALHYSFLEEDIKSELIAEFQAEYERLAAAFAETA